MKNFLQFALVGTLMLGLGACQTLSTPAGVAGAVTKIQTVYTDLKADASAWVATHPTDAAVVAKVEAVLTPEISALSSTTPPTTLASVVADLNTQAQALPSSLLSANTKSELQTAADAVQLLALVAG